jgi:antitoxin VapB
MDMGKRKTGIKQGRTLYIKNPVAHRLAEQVSKQMGVTLSDAVISALEDKVRKTRRPIDRAKIDAIQAEAAALPVLDSRSMDEILGYDEFGLPR